jgi:cytosine deaminase
MDLILRNARLAVEPGRLVDVGLKGGAIAAIEADLTAEGEELDLAGRLLSPGFVETHIHLDKSCIMDRCRAARGDLDEAIREVSRVKAQFTAEDVYSRAKRTLEKSILNGVTHVRTHLEVDPGIGLRGLEGVLPLVSEFAWAVDLEICVFPQEGLLNNEGTEGLMLKALESGCDLIGACPYTDGDPHGQIDRIFQLAEQLDIDIDMHLDFSLDTSSADVEHVCRRTEEYRCGGRVTVGHVTKLSALAPERLDATAQRLANAGVALTSLPSTDLYLMGREHTCNVPRGVTPVHKLIRKGVNCSLATNNVLNPFTPFGDCSLLRIANLYANVAQVGAAADVNECFNMITGRAAKLMNLSRYGLKVGDDADLVVLDCESPAAAVAELATVVHVFKRGRRTVRREPARLHRPQ